MLGLRQCMNLVRFYNNTYQNPPIREVFVDAYAARSFITNLVYRARGIESIPKDFLFDLVGALE